MVRPVAFGFNEQTSANNAFQKQGAGGNISELARRESDEYIGLLEKNGIKVVAKAFKAISQKS